MNPVEIKLFEIVEAIRDGGGDEPGVGDNGWCYMTAATECLWGTSGRGNPNAKRKIQTAARFGVLRIVGRTRLKVSITDKGYALLDRRDEY